MFYNTILVYEIATTQYINNNIKMYVDIALKLFTVVIKH